VKQALSELVKNNLVLEKRGRDSQLFYELNRKLNAEVHRIVANRRKK